jgi:hypothetical protein
MDYDAIWLVPGGMRPQVSLEEVEFLASNFYLAWHVEESWSPVQVAWAKR